MSGKEIRVFKYCSDIHLETKDNFKLVKRLTGIYQFEKLENHRYFLALCGDIGSHSKKSELLKDFLNECSKQYEQVFYIIGNHEYFSSSYTMDQVVEGLKGICKSFKNVHLLENECYQLDEYKILGTTLWSHVDKENEIRVQSSIADYYGINIKDPKSGGIKPFTVSDSNELHDRAIKFLENQVINNNPNKNPCIVLTHFTPQFNNETNKTFTSSPKYKSENPISQAFSTNLDYFLKPPILKWIFGHTHYSTNYMFNQVNILSNQMGYRDDSDGAPFDTNCYFLF